MRTVTTTTKVYTFAELSDEAKENAVNNLSDINVQHEWWESIYMDAENVGLRLTSFDLDRNRHAKGEFTLSALEVAANIIRDHGENCETYKTAKSFLSDHATLFAWYTEEEEKEDGEVYDAEQAIIEREEEFLRDLCEDYSIMLQNDCEYLQSDEAIIETIEANEYEFTEDGELF